MAYDGWGVGLTHGYCCRERLVATRKKEKFEVTQQPPFLSVCVFLLALPSIKTSFSGLLTHPIIYYIP